MTKKLFFIILVFTSLNLLGQSAVLSDFRIDETNKNRVYFNTSKILSSLETSGFTISGKSISSAEINAGQLTNHYFTVTEPFTFWDNNTIRYNGNDSNIAAFTLTYISNLIPEPSSNVDRYVSASAGGGGDGTSEGSAWTFEEAALNAEAGQTVWIKAGEYGNITISIENSGTSNSPIKFIGYTNSPGDILDDMRDSFVYSSNAQATAFIDPSTYPVIRGRNLKAGFGIRTRSSSNIVFRNLCVTNKEYGFSNHGTSSNILYDNCLAGNNYRRGTLFGRGWDTTADTERIRINNSVCFDSSLTNVRVDGSFHLINNTKAASGVFNPGDSGTDYWFSTNKFIDCIVKDSEARRVGKPGHKGHGIGGKSYRHIITNSLWVGNYSEDVQEGFFLAYEDSYNNVFKNNRYYGDPSDKVLAGIVARDGAHDNIWENNFIENVKTGILQWRTSEQRNQPSIYISLNNTFRNNVFKNYNRGVEYFARADAPRSSYTLRGNKIYNNTFYEDDSRVSNYLFVYNQGSLPVTFEGNEFKNNIVHTAHRNYIWGANSSHFQQQYNNYYNCSEVDSGVGNVSVNPQFVNANTGDFHLLPSSPIKDSGLDINSVSLDKDSMPRVLGKYSIGAYDDATPSVGTVSPDISICVGETTTLVASGGSTYLWGGGETTPELIVSPVETTTYTVTITEGENSDSHDVTVTVNDAPSVDLGDDVEMCSGETIVLTAQGEGDFLWNTGETTASISVSPLDTTTYSVIASNSCSTEATDEIVVTVNPGVVIDAGEDVEICIGETVTLTATGNGDFLWSTGETTASIDVTPTTTTSYTVTSNLGECSNEDIIEVTVNQTAAVNILETDFEICSGDDVITLTAEGEGDFLWSTGETTSSISVNPESTTVYTVTASNACSADATDEITITVNPGVTVNAGDDISMCVGETVTLTASGNGDYLWSTGETTASIDVSPTSTTLYTVTSTLGSCSNTDDVEVTVNEAPSVAIIESDFSICSGDSEVTLTASGVGNFLWSTGETTASITVNPTTTTTYSVTASNTCSIDASDEITITVNPGVNVDAGSDVALCTGESVTLTANGNGDYLWSTGETTASISVSPSSTTIYTVTSTLGDCSDSDDVQVTVNESPSVNILESDFEICSGDEVITLTAEGVGNFLWSTGETTSSISINPNVTTTYSVTATNSCSTSASDEITITVNSGVTVNAGDDVSICTGENITLTATGNGDFLWSTGETTASISVSPSSTTLYSVTSTLGGCSNSDDVEVTVNEAPTVNILESDFSICSGETISLTASGNGAFLWNTGQTTSTITVSPSSTTTYSVTSSNTCSTDATDEITITVNPSVTVDAGEDVAICTGENITLTASGNGNFLWSTGETSSSIEVSPSATTIYTVTSSLGDCSDTDQVRVTVNEAPEVTIVESDLSICSAGELVTLTARGSGNFLWSTGETTSTIEVSPIETTTYTVTASSASCSTNDSDEIVITVVPEIIFDVSEDVVICEGEEVILSATSNGDFLWSTGEVTGSISVAPKVTTTYTVRSAIGNFCFKEEAIVVTVIEAPVVDAGPDVTICEGEEITLEASGSGNFLWSTGETEAMITVNPQETTIYTVVSSTTGDCGSSISDTVTVNVNRKPVATANDDIVIISGTRVDLTVSGVGSFEWSTGEVGSRISVSPTTTTTYTVTASTGDGCSIDDEVIVTVVDEFEPTETTIIAGQNITICPGDTVIVEAPTGTQYLWSSGETDRSIKVSPTETSIYSVKVYNGEDSETSHSTITVKEDCTSEAVEEALSSFELDQEVTVYPNPTKGMLNIKIKGFNNISNISVYNTSGTMLYTRTINNELRASVLKEQIDLSRFPKGFYFVKLSNNSKSETKKVLVI